MVKNKTNYLILQNYKTNIPLPVYLVNRFKVLNAPLEFCEFRIPLRRNL